MTDCSVMTLPEAEDRLRYWQAVLGLKDWDIRVFIVRRGLDNTYYGTMTAHENKQQADITLLDPKDDSPEFMREYDMEKTLVHELLHIHFREALPPGARANERGEERAIEALAGALIAFERRVQQ